MIELIAARKQDLSTFIEMESAADTSQFIMSYSLEQHQIEMKNSNVIYLSIMNQDDISGFIILSSDNDFKDIEFRRIVVASKGKGVGQLAIKAMEQYCAAILKANRIWLDVFETNNRGQHIYQKLGYKVFSSEQIKGISLLYMEKIIKFQLFGGLK